MLVASSCAVKRLKDPSQTDCMMLAASSAVPPLKDPSQLEQIMCMRIKIVAHAVVFRIGMVVRVLLLWVGGVEGWFDGQRRLCVFKDWDGDGVEDAEIVMVDINVSLLLEYPLFVYTQQIQL